jgi:ATP synthase protein I
MMAESDMAKNDRGRFDEVQARIDALRAARAPKLNPASEKFTAASLAWRMVTELVVGVLIGAAIGWVIDGALATKPLFLLIFGLLGFAAGVRTVMRSADEVRRRNARDQSNAQQGRPAADDPQ